MIWLVTGIAGLLATVALFTFLFRKKTEETGSAPAPEKDCCGAHAICEKGLKKAGSAILYYDDEELDRYRGLPSNQYEAEQIDLFREVLYTLKQEEIPDWLTSLEAREIALPDLLRPEALDLIQSRN